MPQADSRTATAAPIAGADLFELPFLSESGARLFAELANDGELLALHSGDDLPAWISIALEHPVLRLDDPAPMAPTLLDRGVHLAPFIECGATVAVAVDAEGRCRARAQFPGRTARATDATMSRLWRAIS